MKQNINLVRSLLVMLCLVIAGAACSQEAKKPKTKKAASTKEIVAKPEKSTKKTATKKAVPTKKAKSTAQKPNAKQRQSAGAQKPKTDAKKKAKAKKRPNAKAKAKPNAKAGAKRNGNTAKKSKVAKKGNSCRYIALKTNVPFLTVAVQNLALEVELHKHVSLDLPVMWSISDIEREHGLRTIALQPEGRWWLKSVGTGHFFGLHAHAAWFNLKWEDNRYQTGKRPLLGAGISYGYKLPLSAHWGAEFNIGAGYANMKYDTFYNIENGAQLDTRIRHYWGITRAGLSLVYRF